LSVFTILVEYREAFLSGLFVTIKLFLVCSILGLAFGCVVGVSGARWRFKVGLPSRALSFILSGVPILVFLFWLHYPLQSMLDVVIDPFITAALTLTIINIFGVADIVREALTAFPTQYVVAARVCGMKPRRIFWHVELPIVLRVVIPEALRLQVVVLQSTLFASLISVEELFRVAQRVNANIYRPVEIFSGLGVFFLIICLPLNGIAIWLRHRFNRNLSERG
jgi:His/Glu/Gln/Arg/opine family amino acid ABC transporter permease subunit